MLEFVKKKYNKMNSSHLISDIIISIIIFIAIEKIVAKYYVSCDMHGNFRNLYSTMIGVWATMIGFLITAISILMTLQDNKYLKVLKELGHFKTLMKVLMQTCYISALIICIILLVYIIGTKNVVIENLIIFINILGIKRLFSCFTILYKLIDMSGK